MTSAREISAFILQRTGPISPMKLQKLLYYVQAWSLAWEDRPAFDEDIEAWTMGPVVRPVYDMYKGSGEVRPASRSKTELNDAEQELVCDVLEMYDSLTAEQLSELTHDDLPWQHARTGLPGNARSDRVISHRAMRDFYRAQEEEADLEHLTAALCEADVDSAEDWGLVRARLFPSLESS